MSIYACYIILKEIGFRESKILSFGELDIDIVKNNTDLKSQIQYLTLYEY